MADKTRAGADWWRGSVTYQIYPRCFQDSNGDGIGKGGQVGNRRKNSHAWFGEYRSTVAEKTPLKALELNNTQTTPAKHHR